jgi:hypothetical protein
VGIVKSPSKEVPTIPFRCDTGLTPDQYVTPFNSPSYLLIPVVRAHCMLKHFVKTKLGIDSHFIDLAGAYGGQLVFDVAIFAMTLCKALTVPRGSGFGLLAVIMRDGMYDWLVHFYCTVAEELIQVQCTLGKSSMLSSVTNQFSNTSSHSV